MQFKDVSIVKSDTKEAMQSVLYDENEVLEEKLQLDLQVIEEDSVDKLIVTCKNGEVFGSQPYLAIKTKCGRYYHDNLNEREFLKSWEYIFDRSTLSVDSVEKIGIAANDKYGNQSTAFFS